MKKRSVLLSDVPLEIDSVAEGKIVHAFMYAVVRGAVWEHTQSVSIQGHQETETMIMDMAAHIREMDHSLQSPLDLLNAIQTRSVHMRKDLATRLQDMVVVDGGKAANLLVQTHIKKCKRKTNETTMTPLRAILTRVATSGRPMNDTRKGTPVNVLPVNESRNGKPINVPTSTTPAYNPMMTSTTPTYNPVMTSTTPTHNHLKTEVPSTTIPWFELCHHPGTLLLIPQ